MLSRCPGGSVTQTSKDSRDQPKFYGWRIVWVSAVANAMSMGLGLLNFGLFIQPMEADLAISRAEFGTAQSLRQVFGAFSSPWIGRLLDRHGVRFLLPLSTLVGCLCLALIAGIDAGWQLMVLFSLMGLVGLVGPGQLLTTVPVTKWFVALRPKAIAYMSLGVPFGAVLLMPLTQFLIDDIGWRTTWIVLAVMGIVVICPMCLVWMRRVPEDMGLRPDGLDRSTGEHPDLPVEADWTLKEARRTPVFWQLTFTMGMVAFAISTIALHRLPELIDKGIEPMYVGLAIAWDAVLAGVGMYLFGMAGHRIPVRYVGFVGFAMLSLGVILTIYVQGLFTLLIAMSVWGVGIGGMMYVSNLVWAEYFGREAVGAIRGFATPFTLLLGASGAPVAGYVFDQSGSYDSVWWGSAGLMFVCALVMGVSRKPEREIDQIDDMAAP